MNKLGPAPPTFWKSNGQGSSLLSHMLATALDMLGQHSCVCMCVCEYMCVYVYEYVFMYDILYVCGCGLI